MVDGGEGGDEDGGNGAGAGYAVQGSRTFGVVIFDLELVGDRVHAKSTREIPL